MGQSHLKQNVMFLSEDVLSSNISNMNVMNIFSLLFFSAGLPVRATMLHAMVFICMQVYDLPHVESTTGNYGSKTVVCVACAGTALKNTLNANLIYLRKRS